MEKRAKEKEEDSEAKLKDFEINKTEYSSINHDEATTIIASKNLEEEYVNDNLKEKADTVGQEINDRVENDLLNSENLKVDVTSEKEECPVIDNGKEVNVNNEGSNLCGNNAEDDMNHEEDLRIKSGRLENESSNNEIDKDKRDDSKTKEDESLFAWCKSK